MLKPLRRVTGKQPSPSKPLRRVTGKQPSPSKPLRRVTGKQPSPSKPLCRVTGKQPSPSSADSIVPAGNPHFPSGVDPGSIGQVNIILVGDSNTAGYRDTNGQYLQKTLALWKGANVKTFAKGGLKILGSEEKGDDYLKWLTDPKRKVYPKPQPFTDTEAHVIVITLGTNDIFKSSNNVSFTAADISNKLMKIVNTIVSDKNQKILVVVTEPIALIGETPSSQNAASRKKHIIDGIKSIDAKQKTHNQTWKYLPYTDWKYQDLSTGAIDKSHVTVKSLEQYSNTLIQVITANRTAFGSTSESSVKHPRWKKGTLDPK
jgi:lysophospholipase L1-like esterase